MNIIYRFDKELGIYNKYDTDTLIVMDVVTIMFSTNPTFSWTKCETGFINIYNYSIICGDFSSKLYFPLSNGNSIPCLN